MDFDKIFGEHANETVDEEKLTAASKELFKIYNSFVKAGFTPDQAMAMILAVLQNTLSF